MKPEVDLMSRLERSERRLRLQGALIAVLWALLLVAAFRPPADVIRVRGIAIVDEEGRERILLDSAWTATGARRGCSSP